MTALLCTLAAAGGCLLGLQIGWRLGHHAGAQWMREQTVRLMEMGQRAERHIAAQRKAAREGRQ